MENKLIPYLATQCIDAKSVIVFAPHPDDEVFGCGGAILRHVAAGIPVHVVIVSDGSFGAEGDKKSTVIAKREAESLKAATILGYGEPEFWRLPDRTIAYGEALIQRIMETIELSTADLIYTPSLLEMHPDHRALAMCVIEAVRRAPSKPQLALYEVGVPLHPNLLLDISDLAERKKLAMECFVSQNQQQRYDLDIAALNRYRTYTLPAEVTAAEAYILVTAEELLNDPFKLYQSEHQRQRALGLALNNTDLPLVSVIIRSMDRHTLSEALDSVALQTYANIEIVLVNAKGAEHSALSDWCGNFPMRFIDSSENLGRSHAANVGLNSAKGDYLIFLDDDDAFNPEHIAGLINVLHQQPNTQVAYSGVRAQDTEKNLICLFNYPYEPEKLLITNYIPIHAVLFSRQLIEVNNIRFDTSLDVFEDWDFWLQLSRLTTFIHVDQISAVYHAQGDSGVGLTANKDIQKLGKEQLFDKWRLRWTAKDINNIAQFIVDIEQSTEQLNQSLIVRDHQLHDLNQVLIARDRQLHDLNQVLVARDHHIHNLKQTIDALFMSSSWRMTAPLRQSSTKVKSAINVAKLLPNIIRFGGGLKGTINKTHKIYSREGWRGVKRRILFMGGHRELATIAEKIRPDFALPAVDRNDYTEWVRRYDTLTSADKEKIVLKIDSFKAKPLISVVMPVYNPPACFLDEAIQSVRNQLYPSWELCIADDASTNIEVRVVLERHRQEDSRIKVVYRKTNGHISLASNSAIELATGDWIALLDHDDRLPEHALFWVAEAINENPEVGLIYSDEDKIDESNRRYGPYFKCKFNYELLLAQNMVSHLGIYKTSIIRNLGGFRVGYEGSQDYDLTLRVIEKLTFEQIVHIPRVLYHWRAIAGSTALAPEEKNYTTVAIRKAVTDHLNRMDIGADIMSAPEIPIFNRIRFHCPSPQPLISIIIPTRDRIDLLVMCLDALVQKTTYTNYEIIIIDNGSIEEATLQFFDQLPKDRFSIFRDESSFNFSALNNHGARLARGEFFCLMNNDIEILTPNWLEEMVSFAIRPDIGCVGARLWYPEGGLQHGGAVLGIGGICGHSHKYFQQGNLGYFGRTSLHQAFSVVTGACLLIQRTIFEEVNGLDEQLAVAFNDVDFCLRVREAGYRNIWTPYAEMNHHEFASRGVDDTSEKQINFIKEVEYIKQRWGDLLLNDPAYSPNLTLDYEDFSYAWPPRVQGI